MRTNEQFEAEVFSAVRLKRNKIKKRRAVLISTALCLCVCMSVGVFALGNGLKTGDAVMPETELPSYDGNDGSQSVDSDSTSNSNGALENSAIDNNSAIDDEVTKGESAEGSNVQFTCGNTQTKLYADGKEYCFEGADSVWLSQLLADLEYSPDKLCKCMPEYTVDTEYKTGYGISLGDTPYARCDEGQAELTKEQAERIAKIIENVKSGKVF